ncbi:MAG: hypothetical protein K8I02_08000, partial [Candidatus Methylomirabilis sp.]|nr:hypothetical protein [Deltaproteobacteria bacterium]
TLTAAAAGLGLPRNTARLRRFLDIAQLVIDPSDAFNFAPRWALRPPPGLGPKNVLIQTSVGDPTVPAANQIALMRASGALRGAPLDKVVSAGLVVGARKIPTEEELPGRDARLEDMCICIDGSKRKAQCSGKDEFNEMLGMGEPWRDETWARLGEAAGQPNYTIATFHPSGEHGYFFAPGSVEANGMSLGAERYTLLAQFQALDYVIDPASFTPLARTYRSEDEQCTVDLFGAGAAEALPTFVNFLDLACGSCDLNVTCDAAGPLAPAAGVALNALRLSVWWGPLAFLAALRRRAARRAATARFP